MRRGPSSSWERPRSREQESRSTVRSHRWMSSRPEGTSSRVRKAASAPDRSPWSMSRLGRKDRAAAVKGSWGSRSWGSWNQRAGWSRRGMPRWRRAWHRSWRAKVRRAWGLRESRCRLKPSLATPSMERGMRLTAPRNRPAAAKISRKTGQGKGRRKAVRAAARAESRLAKPPPRL